jgi:hypothetical protein
MSAFHKISAQNSVYASSYPSQIMFHHKIHHYLKPEIPLLEFMHMCSVAQPHPNLCPS